MPQPPPSPPSRRSRLEWQVGLFLINLPVVLLIAWAAWSWHPATPAATPAVQPPTPGSQVPPRQPDPALPDYSKKSPAELERLLQEKQRQLGKASPETIDQAAKLIGLDAASKPARTTGPFDFKRSTVQSFEKVIAKDGRYGYHITFVDDVGTTCPVDIPPDEVSSTEDTAYALYERAKNDPIFKKLLDLAARKIMAREK